MHGHRHRHIENRSICIYNIVIDTYIITAIPYLHIATAQTNHTQTIHAIGQQPYLCQDDSTDQHTAHLSTNHQY